MTRRRLLTVGLAALAVLCTFTIGIITGVEIARAPAAARTAAQQQPQEGWSPIPRELLQYRLRLRVRLPLEQPRGFAVGTDGTLFVCGDQSLVVVERSGAARARFDLEGRPRCVAVGGEHTVYVGLEDHVVALDTRSGAVTSWPDLGSQAIVTSIAVAGPNVYVGDAGNRMLLSFGRTGRLLCVVDRSFNLPSPFLDVSAGPDGTVWATNPGDHRVQKYSADGRAEGSWGDASAAIDGFIGCCNPVHLAVLPCGEVATSEKGVPRVKVYSPDGRLEAVVAGPQDFPPGTTTLSLATRKANGGEVLVLVPTERAIRVYCHSEIAGDD
ncbi:MAG TPA: hypothetical protein VMQ10_16760 [Spirochaetia bacterium]|nr:hypothetical protein [Spirochaetia bacterium]